jgi:CubicO group peptidase (beta-lactamase class C family)
MKIRLSKNLLLLIVLLFAGLEITYAQTIPSPEFDEYVNKALKEWEVPGVAIAIVKDDKIVMAKGYGTRELGKSLPVDERTLFAIGSSSKAFTAAGIAMLVDEGKVKWDDPVTKHLPGFQLFDPYATRELTVSDLLTLLKAELEFACALRIPERHVSCCRRNHRFTFEKDLG